MMPLSLLLIISLLFDEAKAEKDSNPYSWGQNPNKRFRMYWNDARNVIQDLDKFSSLHVRYHGCVWSECQIDNYDDDGENRDGDEQWYQYRTQQFCANAAYSLYGHLKGTLQIGRACRKGTYINSFFTYGSSDTLLRALSGDYANDDDDGGNAVCYEIENENENSGDGGQGLSSIMGCTEDGKFATATFADDTCDGNYFVETTDSLGSYNREMNNINCKQIWSYGKDASNYDFGKRRRLDNDDNGYVYVPKSRAEALLSESWACSSEIYGDACPDPYGLKAKYDSILYRVSHGQSASAAVILTKLQTPAQVFTWLFAVTGTVLLLGAYYMKRTDQIKSKGFLAVLAEDSKKSCMGTLQAMREGFRKEKREKKMGEQQKEDAKIMRTLQAMREGFVRKEKREKKMGEHQKEQPKGFKETRIRDSSLDNLPPSGKPWWSVPA